MTGRPETQTSTANASFTKKLGLPTVPIFKVTSHAITPTAFDSQQTTPFTREGDFSSEPSPSLPSCLLCSSPTSPCPNVGILNPNQIKKKKINKDRVFLFCFNLVFFRLHLLLRSPGLELSGLKSDDKIINGSRAMSYLISCIFMKGAHTAGTMLCGEGK